MIHASLFSGIGGFDLAAEWAGWTNAFNCEIDKFCQKILKYHFPNARQYADIKTTDFSEWNGRVDVLTGGFPCQPFSVAGKRLGTDDNRHLWPEMLRAIREISPQWVVGENVLGFVSWSDGLVLESVCADLENTGYQVQPFIIPACSVNAPHRRDRVWIVAYRNDARTESAWSEWHDSDAAESIANTYGNRFGHWTNKQKSVEGSCGATDACFDGKDDDASNPNSKRRHEQQPPAKSEKTQIWNSKRDSFTDYWRYFPTESPVCCGDDGLSDRLDAITFPAWRRESIKAYGNAIVPQVAYRIFETINQFNE